MKVTPIARTEVVGEPTGFIYGDWCMDADELAEMAGRACYQSWSRPNPATATNEGYLRNIIDQGHFSVLEHASISFYVEGVSRALLTELERHRFLSFSVISQRYVGIEDVAFVMPPALVTLAHDLLAEDGQTKTDDEVRELFQKSPLFDDVREAYTDVYDELRERGSTKKEAREAARAFLPNCTETKFVVTGNIRCWRDVISKRYHEAADAEIRKFATEVLSHLRVIAPNSLQDIPEQPFSDSTHLPEPRYK